MSPSVLLPSQYKNRHTNPRISVAARSAATSNFSLGRSQLLVGLSIATVEEALKRSLTEDDSAIARWLLQTFNG